MLWKDMALVAANALLLIMLFTLYVVFLITT